MEPQFQRSFIPKKPIVAPTAARVSSPINLLSLIATVIFIVSLALAGGSYFYRGLLQKQIADDQTSLDRAKGAFEPELINQIVRLDSRIEQGKKLLSSHVSVTPLFDLLSKVTLPTVRFKDFSFAYLSPTKVSVAMKGQADSYSSIALQSDLINAQKAFSDTVISDLALDPQGTVSFSVASNIDPTLVSYAASAAAQASQGTANGQSSTQASSSPMTAIASSTTAQ